MQFSSYDTEGFYDEMFEPDGRPRPHARLLLETVESLLDGQLLRYKRAAERMLLQMGITFNVYGDTAGAERIFPFDLIPRIVPAAEWDRIERGLKQRVHALNAFIDDIYHDQKILRDLVIPSEVILSAVSYRKQCHGLNPPWRVWRHVTGTDLARDRDGQYYVLEDNLRVPSGVSYVLENREVLKHIFPAVFEGLLVRPVTEYPSRLLEMLESIAPRPEGDPRVVLLTPGIYNSAYFEHSYLAQQMGVQLVEGRDLAVDDRGVFMRTTKGLERVDVIYRRIDDDFLDPQAFRKDSLLGVSGLMAAYQGPGFAFFTMNSGLRSLRDKILLHFEEAFARETEVRDRLFKVVNLYAQQVRRVAEEDGAALHRAELKFNAYSLIGGQMSGDSTHRLFMVYPEGNWVEIGPDTPYQIIGASGFGKPILERSVTYSDSMLYAFKVGLLAFDATRLCAADVDFPMDVILYSRGSFQLVEQRYDRDDLREISNWWQDRMRRSVQDLPSEWIEAAFSRLTHGELASEALLPSCESR